MLASSMKRIFFRKERPVEVEPIEQLKLVHDEMNLQRTLLSQRLSNIQNRATVLITGAGILGAFTAGSWPSMWQGISVGLSVAAAIVGIAVLRPRRGIEANATLHWENRLRADPYSAEFSIFKDKIEVLEEEFDRVKNAGQIVMVGYGILVAAWAATFIIAVLTNLKII
jgi:hypothetical protein